MTALMIAPPKKHGASEMTWHYFLLHYLSFFRVVVSGILDGLIRKDLATDLSRWALGGVDVEVELAAAQLTCFTTRKLDTVVLDGVHRKRVEDGGIFTHRCRSMNMSGNLHLRKTTVR